MTIEVTERLIGLWFVSLPGHDDWMAGLTEEPDGILLTYRFRYANPADPGAHPYSESGAADRKSWYTVRFKGTREEAIADVRGVAQRLADVSHTQVDEVMMNPERDPERFVAELQTRRFAHAAKGRIV